MITNLGIILLAGYGWMTVLDDAVQRAQHIRRLSAFAVAVIIFIESWSSLSGGYAKLAYILWNQAIDVQARPVDVWLSRLAKKLVVFEVIPTR